MEEAALPRGAQPGTAEASDRARRHLGLVTTTACTIKAGARMHRYRSWRRGIQRLY